MCIFNMLCIILLKKKSVPAVSVVVAGVFFNLQCVLFSAGVEF
jgi:hypothetical protein